MRKRFNGHEWRKCTSESESYIQAMEYIFRLPGKLLMISWFISFHIFYQICGCAKWIWCWTLWYQANCEVLASNSFIHTLICVRIYVRSSVGEYVLNIITGRYDKRLGISFCVLFMLFLSINLPIQSLRFDNVLTTAYIYSEHGMAYDELNTKGKKVARWCDKFII